MAKIYHILRKKAIFGLVLASFLFSAPVLAKIPNDSTYQTEMWRQINAPEAWDYATGSKRVIVAVIDTGADTWHDDLRANIWQNPYEIPDNGLDDDHNGYVDDVNGWNFIEDNNEVRTSVFDIESDKDAVNHGTIVAGLVGAVGNNGINGLGINWNVSIMPLRAVNSGGSGDVEGVVEAINYAVNNGAAVISLSLVIDVDMSGELKNFLYDAYKKGVVIVSAAGNGHLEGTGDLSKYPLYPVCIDAKDQENWLIGVSAVDNQDKLSVFANYGKGVDLLAPGQGVFSTERYSPSYGYAQDFGGGWNGTSFAVPIVAGGVALIKSVRPDLDPKQIIELLLKTADNIDAKNPEYKGLLGYGRLNIGRAVRTAAETKPAKIETAKYFISGNNILKQEAGAKTKRYFAKVSDAKILKIAVGDLNEDGHDEIALLIQRKNYFYVQILRDNGMVWQEKGVIKTKSVSKISYYRDQTGLGGLKLETINNKNKKMTLIFDYESLLLVNS